MGVKDNLNGGTLVNGYDITLPVKSGQTISKGDPVYMSIATPEIVTSYIDCGINGQSYSSTKAKYIWHRGISGFFVVYTTMEDGYMYVHIREYYAIANTSYRIDKLREFSIKTSSKTALSGDRINYVYNNKDVILWFSINNVLYMIPVSANPNDKAIPKLYTINLLASAVTKTISETSVNSFSPTSSSIKGCVLAHNLLCFHLIRANSTYRAFEMLAVDVSKFTINSITAYRTASSSENSVYYADIQSSGNNVICYHRAGTFTMSSTGNSQNLYDTYPPTIFMYMCDPQAPTSLYSRQNAIGSTGNTSRANGVQHLIDTYGKLSSTHINKMVIFGGSYLRIYLPDSYQISTNNYGDELKLYTYNIGYSTHANAYSSKSNSDVNSVITAWDNADNLNKKQSFTATYRDRTSMNGKGIHYTYQQDTRHATTITVSCADLPTLVTPTKLVTNTINAYYTACKNFMPVAYSSVYCVFIDTVEGHVVATKNPTEICKYNISGHSKDLPIGISKNSASGGNTVKIRNYVI